MAILVGIDEAGYGPLLGPLLVGSAVFSLPDDLLKSDHWKLLSRAVGREKKSLSGRILITDSKKAYSRSSGLGHLRRTVLASVLALDRCGELPRFAGQLLEALECPCVERLGGYQWYEGLGEMELAADGAGIEIASGVFGKCLADNGLGLLDMTCRVLDVGYYNRMVSAVRNKASVLFTAICGIITDVLKSSYVGDGEMVQIIVDRQGGRVNYVPPLRKMFAGMELRVIRQDPAICSYELCGRGKVMRLHFATKADLKYMPVALASMTSKYVREILVEAINAYFIKHCADLKPTAGYWKDGQRFVSDLAEHLPELKYDAAKLIRSR